MTPARPRPGGLLTTGVRPDVRFRCKDVMPSGRRVVGPFREADLEVIAVCSLFTPAVPRKP